VKLRKNFLVVLAFVFSLFAAPAVSNFDVEANSNTITVNVKIEGIDSTLLDTTTVEIEASDLTPIIGGNSVHWTSNTFAAHALVAAFEKNGYDPSDTSVVGGIQSGFITNVLGLPSAGMASWMFALNNATTDMTIDQQVMQDGDLLTLYYLEDWSTQGYSFFDQNSMETLVNKDVNLIINREVLNFWTWTTSVEPAVNAKLIIEEHQADGTYIRTTRDDIRSDANGNFNFSLDKAGTYRISAFLGDGTISQITRNSVLVTVSAYSIDASDFAITTAQANEISDADIIKKAEAISSISSGGANTVSGTLQVKEHSIATTPGTYTATFHVSEDTNVVKTVNVIVAEEDVEEVEETVSDKLPETGDTSLFIALTLLSISALTILYSNRRTII